MLKDCISD